METSTTNEIATDTSQATAARLGARVWRLLTFGDHVGRRTAVVVWSAGAIGLGLWLSWSWIVAAGLSSLVLAILPCAAMCAAGLCAGRSDGNKN